MRICLLKDKLQQHEKQYWLDVPAEISKMCFWYCPEQCHCHHDWGWIGVIENSATIFPLFSRRKERGERLCYTPAWKSGLTCFPYVMFDEKKIPQNTVVCKVSLFLQICFPEFPVQNILVVSIHICSKCLKLEWNDFGY